MRSEADDGGPARHRTDRRDWIRSLAGIAVGERGAVGNAGEIDTLRIDVLRAPDGFNQARDEPNIVDVVAVGGTAAETACVPAAAETVRVGDDKAAAVGLGIPMIGASGLQAGAKPAMQHNDQRR